MYQRSPIARRGGGDGRGSDAIDVEEIPAVLAILDAAGRIPGCKIDNYVGRFNEILELIVIEYSATNISQRSSAASDSSGVRTSALTDPEVERASSCRTTT